MSRLARPAIVFTYPESKTEFSINIVRHGNERGTRMAYYHKVSAASLGRFARLIGAVSAQKNDPYSHTWLSRDGRGYGADLYPVDWPI